MCLYVCIGKATSTSTSGVDFILPAPSWSLGKRKKESLLSRFTGLDSEDKIWKMSQGEIHIQPVDIHTYILFLFVYMKPAGGIKNRS